MLGVSSIFHISACNLKVSAGVGFIVALTGNLMAMPGLS